MICFDNEMNDGFFNLTCDAATAKRREEEGVEWGGSKAPENVCFCKEWEKRQSKKSTDDKTVSIILSV